MLVQPWSMFKMLATDAGHSVRRVGVLFTVVMIALACGVSQAQSLAKLQRLANATRTVLNSTVEETAAGERVTFTARVSNWTGGAVRGAVLFCRSADPVCSGPSVVGEAQLKGDGTATMTKVFGPGNYAIVARYAGTKSASPSTSNVLTGSVTGQIATATAIAYRKQQGAVAIGSTVSAFGTVTPTGSVFLLDMANGGVSIGSAPLVSSSVYQSFQQAGSLQSRGRRRRSFPRISTATV